MARPLRHLARAAALLVVGVVVLWFLQFNRQPDNPNPSVNGAASAPADAPTAVAAAAAVTTVQRDVGPSTESTESAVLAAAVRYLELSEDLVEMSPAEAASVQRRISTADAADRLAVDVEAQLAELIEEFPAGLTLWVAPISAFTRPVGDEWEVSIWYVQVVAITGETVRDIWKTVTYRLADHAGEWKIADKVSVSGPTPASSAATVVTPAVALAAMLGGFDDDGLTP